MARKSKAAPSPIATAPALRSASGFTLIEVLVAVFVMAIMVTAITQISGTSAKSSRSMANKTQEVWQREARVLSYVEALSSGRNPEVPDGLTVVFEPSGELSQSEESTLRSTGWRLSTVSISDSRDNSLLWRGPVLVRDGGS